MLQPEPIAHHHADHTGPDGVPPESVHLKTDDTQGGVRAKGTEPSTTEPSTGAATRSQRGTGTEPD
jgi:hypothetical protein